MENNKLPSRSDIETVESVCKIIKEGGFIMMMDKNFNYQDLFISDDVLPDSRKIEGLGHLIASMEKIKKEISENI